MNATKELHQQEAFEALKKSNFNGMLLASVGFGKGRVICMAIEELYKAGNKTFLYCCDNQRLRDVDFPGELDKWLPSNIRSSINLELQCYQTTCRWTNKKYDVLIGDEADYSITPEYIKVYYNTVFKHKILFSGTLNSEKKKLLLQIVPIVYNFSVKKAEDAGVVNKTEYFVYNFKMSESESRTYNSLTKKIATLMAANVGFDDPDMTFWLRKRKHFLNGLDTSYVECRKVMRHFYNQNNKNRLVIFSELTQQADRICKYSYHGKNEDLDNLSKFQSGEINALATVAKIQRGINLKNANIFIFESMSGSTTKMEQKGGRAKRLGVDETATIVFMIPYYLKRSFNGDTSWVPSIVSSWVKKATGNLKHITLKTLKV